MILQITMKEDGVHVEMRELHGDNESSEVYHVGEENFIEKGVKSFINKISGVFRVQLLNVNYNGQFANEEQRQTFYAEFKKHIQGLTKKIHVIACYFDANWSDGLYTLMTAINPEKLNILSLSDDMVTFDMTNIVTLPHWSCVKDFDGKDNLLLGITLENVKHMDVVVFNVQTITLAELKNYKEDIKNCTSRFSMHCVQPNEEITVDAALKALEPYTSESYSENRADGSFLRNDNVSIYFKITARFVRFFRAPWLNYKKKYL